MTGNVEWSAPGSILLTGEYLVTEEGGQGLAMAVGPRGSVRLTPGGGSSVEAVWPGGSYTWSAKSGPGNCLPAVLHNLIPDALENRLILDTSDFFFPGGRKKGFGSSAAAAVLLATAMTGGEDGVEDLAIRGHRLFQGGRGSGYDVLTSFHGGMGVFGGGEKPSWIPVRWPRGIEAAILPGKTQVKTRGAVERFRQWKNENPTAAEDFRIENRKVATDLENILSGGELTDPALFLAALGQAAELGIRLGRNIGVPAEPDLPADVDEMITAVGDGIVLKSLGAGNELILAASLRGGLSSGVRRRSILEDPFAEGLREEPS